MVQRIVAHGAMTPIFSASPSPMEMCLKVSLQQQPPLPHHSQYRQRTNDRRYAVPLPDHGPLFTLLLSNYLKTNNQNLITIFTGYFNFNFNVLWGRYYPVGYQV